MYQLLSFTVAVLLFLPSLWFGEARAAPKLEAPISTPGRVLVGTTADVLVTQKISSSARKKTVRLFQEKRIATALNKRVKSWKAPVKMNDSGTKGDAVAGDGVYSAMVSIKGDTPGWVRLRTQLTAGGKRSPSQIAALAIATPANLAVPDLTGLTQAEAQQRLRGAGFVAGQFSESIRIFARAGTVAAQTPISGATLLEGSPVDVVLAAPLPAKAGETLPANWAGRWQITTVYRDAATGAVDSAVEVIDNLCAADPMGLALLEQAAGNTGVATDEPACTGQAATDGLRLTCSAKFDASICTARASSELNLNLEGDALRGVGLWKVDESCGLPLESKGQTLSLTGKRLGPPEPDACSKPASSFLQKFIENPLLRFFEVVL